MQSKPMTIEFQSDRHGIRDIKGDEWGFISEVKAEGVYDNESGFMVDFLTVTKCKFYRMDQAPTQDLECDSLAVAPDCFAQSELAELEHQLERDAINQECAVRSR